MKPIRAFYALNTIKGGYSLSASGATETTNGIFNKLFE